MRIVDAQVHIWAANSPERPWPARAEPHRAPLGKQELLPVPVLVGGVQEHVAVGCDEVLHRAASGAVAPKPR